MTMTTGDVLFAMLLNGVTLKDGTHIQGYQLVNFSALVLNDNEPTPEMVVNVINHLDAKRPWENAV